MPRKVLLINVAALSPVEVGAHTPTLQHLAASGGLHPLLEPFPSLTSSSHATAVTGLLPRDHGMVGNCLYSREYATIRTWNRSSHLVSGTPIWEAARARDSRVRTANLFFRQCADATCDIRITERPVYWTDGRKQGDFFAEPHALHDALVDQLGPFPFFNFWGPRASLVSSQWILSAAEYVMQHSDPELLLVYPPYLDYEGARFGPSSPEVARALRAMDAALEPLVRAARAQGRDIMVMSDYGFEDVSQPVFLNRVLRRAGYLTVQDAPNGERLEPGASRAFAVCDNQIAHVYIANPADISAVRSLLEATDGVDEVLDTRAQARVGVDHPRSGELIATSSAGAWFAYPYWLDPKNEPDFARCMAIFDKIGTDTCELFGLRGLRGKLHASKRIAQMKVGLKAPADIIDPDERRVRGARRIARDNPQRRATLICSWALSRPGAVPMEDLKDIILSRMFD